MNDLSDSDDEAYRERYRDGAHATSLRARIDLEFELYMAHKVSISSTKKATFEVITWWKLSGAEMFPVTARVARSILCMPAFKLQI